MKLLESPVLLRVARCAHLCDGAAPTGVGRAPCAVSPRVRAHARAAYAVTLRAACGGVRRACGVRRTTGCDGEKRRYYVNMTSTHFETL